MFSHFYFQTFSLQKGASKEGGQSTREQYVLEPVHQNKDGTVTVNIVAKPGSKQNMITG